MSLSKKMTLGFIAGALIIALLTALDCLIFLRIGKEMRNLELADTIHSMSLQLVMHQKDFFLFGPSRPEQKGKEIRASLAQLQGIVTTDLFRDQEDRISRLGIALAGYSERFERICSLISRVSAEFAVEKPRFGRYEDFLPITEPAFYERPLEAAKLFEKVLAIPPNHRLITGLTELDKEATLLRKNGDDILTFSRELYKIERDNTARAISASKTGILVFFSLFISIGMGTLLFTGRHVVKRLGLLTAIGGTTGQAPGQKRGEDEIGEAIRRFKTMEELLVKREEELSIRDKELVKSKKLAAIGTLASGIAHELGNPLNNIHISSQVLQQEAGEECSPFVKEILDDIVSQSIRVKKIVGDLLEYARGKEPRFETVELNSLIKKVSDTVLANTSAEDVHFTVNTNLDAVTISADREQIERAFINLFTHSIESMKGKGEIIVTLNEEEEAVNVRVSDTGKGIRPEDAEKIFEPFSSTEGKGTGLGLAIVFNTVKKHGGEIFAEGQEDKGTTFCMVFPKGEKGHAV